MNTIDFTTLKPAEYARKSSESEDKQMLSIISQHEENQVTANYHRLPNFVEVFQEARSAKTEFMRPEFSRMMQMIDKGMIDSIVCWKLDRLARNMTEGGKIIDLLSSGKIKSIITHDKVFYPWDNVIVMSVEFSQGKQFVKDLSVNVKRGQTKKASMGVPHGVATLGFLNDKTEDKGNRNWLVDKSRLEKIGILLKMFLTGTWSAGRLYEYAIEELKLTTVTRKRTGGQPIQRSRIYTILTDPIYAGFFFYGGERYELAKELPRLITEEEHSKIKMILGKRHIPKTQTHETVFGGYITSPENEFVGADVKYQVICDCTKKFAYRNKTHCPACGVAIDKMLKPKYLDYTYHYNVSKKKRGEKYKSVSESTITGYLLETLGDELFFSPELADWSRKHIKELQDQEINEQLVHEEVLKQSAEDLTKKKKRLREMLADKQITDEEYRSDLADAEAHYKPTSVETNGNWINRAHEIVDLSTEFVRIMEQSGSVKAKRAVLSKLGSNLIWNDEKLSIINSKPVQALLDGVKLIQDNFPEFEPKIFPYLQGLNEKIRPESPIFSIMLPR